MNAPFLPPNKDRVRRRRRPARVDALDVLPVFFDMKGKRALIAGDSEAAAWKAELLAASGAEVHVFAAEPCAMMRTFLAADPVSGAVVHHQKDWRPADLAGTNLAICDAVGEDEARSFVEAARHHGVPANVIDQPEWCDFRFGSIVNRSPIVIGISTSGFAPILGQAVRRRIEAVLPLSLSSWAALAGRLRERVLQSLRPGAERRAFWEHFADRAFEQAPGPSVEHELAATLTVGDFSDVRERRSHHRGGGRSGGRRIADTEGSAHAAGRRCDPL